MSEAIRNVAAIPNTAKSPKEAADFIGFILSADGQRILSENGQPPVVPAIRKGDVSAGLKS
jgi:molybdate/tungstate transport system substrate-binding protein